MFEATCVPGGRQLHCCLCGFRVAETAAARRGIGLHGYIKFASIKSSSRHDQDVKYNRVHTFQVQLEVSALLCCRRLETAGCRADQGFGRNASQADLKLTVARRHMLEYVSCVELVCLVVLTCLVGWWP